MTPVDVWAPAWGEPVGWAVRLAPPASPLVAPARLGADLPWPDDVRREMDALDKDVMALQGDVEADKQTDLSDVKNSYYAWVAEWRRWYAENRESWALYYSAVSVQKELKAWAQNQRTWRDEFTRRGVKNRVPIPPAPPIPPPSTTPGGQVAQAASDAKWALFAALGIVTILAFKK